MSINYSHPQKRVHRHWTPNFQGYELSMHQLTAPLVEASLRLYKAASSTFLPTPAKCHYMFNLRDFARVIEGVRLVSNTHLRDPNKLVRLWCHEAYRSAHNITGHGQLVHLLYLTCIW